MKFWVVSTIWDTFFTVFLGNAGLWSIFELFRFEELWLWEMLWEVFENSSCYTLVSVCSTSTSYIWKASCYSIEFRWLSGSVTTLEVVISWGEQTISFDLGFLYSGTFFWEDWLDEGSTKSWCLPWDKFESLESFSSASFCTGDMIDELIYLLSLLNFELCFESL